MFKGSMVALVTPMSDDGAIDFDALASLIEFHVEAGTDAIVAVGTSGESSTLSVPEHATVIRFVVEHAAGRVPVIAGTGANATSEAIALTEKARDDGADACLLVTPYYNKPSQEGLFRHFEAVARAVAIPQILYNVPGRTALDMAPETTARLSYIDNIVGIKEALGEVSRIRELLERCRDGFHVITGDDATAMESMLAGGHGDISVTANVVPREMHLMCKAAMAGNRAEAEAIEARIAPLHKALFLESNPIPVKWALAEMGRIGPGIRLPLTPLADEYHDAVRAALSTAGVSGTQTTTGANAEEAIA
ncbi:MAG: 4-hydroxy-tetrahydrodipicolinate synthase [Gammaproteobacteria bacterium]|nr:MAG: 4-hydroxy-tetrahydrodipicolinate synthase [Gammaproteobacteria bacterium]